MLIIFITFYITSLVLILELIVCTFWPPSSNSLAPRLTLGNQKSDLFFYDFVSLFVFEV